MRTVAPIRCPHCRSRLTTKYWAWRGVREAMWMRWCKRCRCTVVYIWNDEDPEVLAW